MNNSKQRFVVATFIMFHVASSLKCCAHETPFIDIRVDPMTQQLLPQVNSNFAVLEGLFGLIFIDSPGFGVTFPVNGVSTDTVLEMEAVGRLLFWNGVNVASTAATLTFENPEMDDFDNPVVSPVADYLFHQTSERQAGMVWGTYTGDNNWHADGFYELSSGSAPGIYGLPLRLHGSGLQRSDTFLFPLVYDPNGAWSLSQRLAAIDELRTELAGFAVADFDSNLEVDNSDLSIWQNGFGQNGSTEPADGNDDNSVDGSDFMAWQQQFGTTTTPTVALQSVPEPAASSCLFFCASMLLTLRRTRTIFH